MPSRKAQLTEARRAESYSGAFLHYLGKELPRENARQLRDVTT